MQSRFAIFRSLRGLALTSSIWLLAGSAVGQDATATIERIKGSIVRHRHFRAYPDAAISNSAGRRLSWATERSWSPMPMSCRACSTPRDWSSSESCSPGRHRDKVQFREAKQVAVDPGSDLAVLKIGGAPLPAMQIRDSDGVKEGQAVMFTGFPIGAALGALSGDPSRHDCSDHSHRHSAGTVGRTRPKDHSPPDHRRVSDLPARRDSVSRQQRQPGLRSGDRRSPGRGQHGVREGDEGIDR